MSYRAIALVSDDRFLPHAKALMVNCRRQGRWSEDFVVLCAPSVPATAQEDLQQRGVNVVKVPAFGFLMKFWLFSERLRYWRQVFYLDCDCLVQDDLHRVFSQLDEAEPLSDGTKPIIADREDVTALQTWQRTADKAGGQAALMEELVREYPHVCDRFWNTAFLLFEPASIPFGTVASLVAFQVRFQATNDRQHGGTDQEIIHAVLYDRFRMVRDKMFCYYGIDTPRHRGPSESRGFKGGEFPVAVHYCRWAAPWLNLSPGAYAYKNQRLSVVCREFYQRNLDDFEKVFPRQ